MRKLLAIRVDRFRSFGGDSGIIFAARVLQNVNGLLLSIAVVRRFGLGAAGTLALATVPTVVMATLGTFGLTYHFAQTDRPNATRNAIGLSASLLSIVIAFPIVGLAAVLLSKNPGERTAIFLLGLAGPFFAITNLLNSLLVLQSRLSLLMLSPLGNLVGLLLGYTVAASFSEFSGALALARFVGVFSIFICLPIGSVSREEVWTGLRRGMRFLTGDLINLGSDQFSVVLASIAMSRADLGMFGLCRQMLTVSDTPGWSRLTAIYPALHADPIGRAPAVKREMLIMGVVCGAGVAVLAVILGFTFYRLPRFAILAPLLLASVPIRYLLSGLDTTLRAIGAIAMINRVTLLRALVLLGIVYVGGLVFAAPGAILAMIVQTCFAAWLTNRAVGHQLSLRKTGRLNDEDLVADPAAPLAIELRGAARETRL